VPAAVLMAAGSSVGDVGTLGEPQDSFTPDGQYRVLGSEMGLLGSGAHGIVRIAQHVHTQEFVAVKITPTSVVRSSCKEMTALARLSSPYIVQLLGVQVDMHTERVYIIMELCQGGELFDRIAECGGLPEEDAKRYFVQILSALCHCHDNGIFHRDLKPENILLDDDDNAKVADFGLAAVYRHVYDDKSFLQHTKVGSVMYAAPEVLVSTASTGYDAARADVWSLGIILFSMLSGTLPFECAAASRCKRYAAVLRQGIQVMCPEHLSGQVTSLLARLLHPDPTQRFTPQQALRCDWLRDVVHTVSGPRLSACAAMPPPAAPRSWTIMFRLVEPKEMDIDMPVLESPKDGERKRKLPDGEQPPSGEQPAPAPLPPQPQQQVQQQPLQQLLQQLLPQQPPLQQPQQPPVAQAQAQAQAPTPTPTPTPPLGSASGSGGTADSATAVPGGRFAEGLPLQSSLSQFVHVWGWEPLPRGTKQLLGDIFQTLHNLGLQYTLHEQQAGATEEAQTAGSSGQHRVLILKINFAAQSRQLGLTAAGGTAAGRPPGGTAGAVT